MDQKLNSVSIYLSSHLYKNKKGIKFSSRQNQLFG